MLKLVIYFIVGYLGYKFYKNFLAKPSLKDQVSGQNKNEPLDLADNEVEDAHFEDLPKDKK